MVFRKFRSKTFLTAAAVLSIVTLGLIGAHGVNASANYVQECTDNAIMRCGAGTPASFIANAKANKPSDLQTIYAASGLSTSEYSRFASTAKKGTVYKSTGKIVVDGQTVINNVWSFGRQTRAHQWVHKINGKTYYASYSKDMMTVPSTPVMVMFDKTGNVEFAVMDSCGNPMMGKKVTPKYSCDLLQKTAVSGKKDTYRFTTKASASNNAKVAKFVYNFGDGTTATTTSGSKAVEHTFKKPGNYNVTVTVYVNVPGGNTATVTSAKCKTTVTVAKPPVKPQPKPYYQCVALFGSIVNKDNLEYKFVVTTKQGNGATLKSADFNFGDNQTAKAVAPATANTVSTTHSFAKEGKYTVTATVHFTVSGTDKSVTCETPVDTGTTPPPVCKYDHNLPANSPECGPCEFNHELPKTSPKCTPPVLGASTPTPPKPTVLPNTGAGSMIGLFLGTSIAGGALYRWRLARKAFNG
ncbi:MAG TPA: PKD domain-containing protein [Candidatus Saccharimonadales bacterium]|nr:PKD domain-containing protein [Candidatus Saccharimonadales bacterium]